MEEEPTSESHLSEIRGETFQNYEDFYSAYAGLGSRPIVRIHGKKIENGELVDDPSGFVDAMPHKISDHYANMNVYEDGKVIAYFRLDQNTIHQFRIEIVGK